MADAYRPGTPSGAGAGRARETEPAASLTGRSPVEIVKDVVGNVQEIIRSEIRLAKAEMSETAKKGSRAGVMMAAGAIIGLYALGFLLVCIYNAISTALPPWLSALIVGVVLAIAGGALLGVGYKRCRRLSPRPERTVQSVREDVQWLKTQTR